MENISTKVYSDLISEVSKDCIPFIPKECSNRNNVIFTLLNPTDLHDFKNEFKECVGIVYKYLSKSEEGLKKINNLLVNISKDKTWEGSYAELVAYAYLIKNSLHPITSVDITLSSEDSFAKEFGKPNDTNLDGFIKDISLYFDIKILQDVPMDIFDGIFCGIRKTLKNDDILIVPKYDKSKGISDFQKNYKDLFLELYNALKTGKQPSIIRSKIIEGLSYDLLFANNSHMTATLISPYRHAKKLHTQFFNYGNKFLKNEKTLIIFVISHLYNRSINFGPNFYRAISRRFFCQYMHSDQKYNTINPEFVGTETCFEITKKLSAILFLEDKCLNKSGTDAFLYSNPNADNPLIKSKIDYPQFNTPLKTYDDFIDDNY